MEKEKCEEKTMHLSCALGFLLGLPFKPSLGNWCVACTADKHTMTALQTILARECQSLCVLHTEERWICDYSTGLGLRRCRLNSQHCH